MEKVTFFSLFYLLSTEAMFTARREHGQVHVPGLNWSLYPLYYTPGSVVTAASSPYIACQPSNPPVSTAMRTREEDEATPLPPSATWAASRSFSRRAHAGPLT